jgi:Homeodomain-like domain
VFVHSATVREAAAELLAQGLSDCEVGRQLGVPRRTVRDWRIRPSLPRGTCPRCWKPTSPVAFNAPDYAELLGLYLGDGHITVMARTERLRLMLDAKYCVIVDDAAALLARFVPRNKVGRQFPHDGRMVTLHAYHGHWTCLLPQHGPGKKHEREIRLEPWQSDALAAAPWSFLRGCIRSDGCFFINRTGKYAYESYDFANVSRDILDLFAWTCDRVGVEYRRYAKDIRIYRRASVALMLEHVGRKV